VSPAVHLVSLGVTPLAAADPESATVASALAAAGTPVTARAFVDDDETALEAVVAGEGGLTIVLAGPGGSAGDVVRRVVARAAGARLALNERMLGALEESYRRRDRPLPRRAERLALLPQGATLWIAGDGEPGWMLDSPRGAFAVLPRGSAGLGAVVDEHLVPFARSRAVGRGAVLIRTLRTAGVAVGELEERLVDWLGKEGDVSVTVVPADGEAWVRLRARGSTPVEATAALASVEAQIAAALGDDCYGRDAESLEQVVGRLLRERELTLAVAESCTGGLLGHRITNLPGSSAYFERGVIVYSNRAKMALLGVPEAVLRAHGAVSGPTAEAMARGICASAGTPCGLSITGVAGPDGGTPAKPVGTVFIGLAFRDAVISQRFRFSGDRASVKWQSSQMALDMLRRKLGGA
jgi:competence/damage-inducible protein CinA-like protein